MTASTTRPELTATEALVWIELIRQGLPRGWAISLVTRTTGSNAYLVYTDFDDDMDPDLIREGVNALDLMFMTRATLTDAIRRLKAEFDAVTWEEIERRKAWCLEHNTVFRMDTYGEWLAESQEEQ